MKFATLNKGVSSDLSEEIVIGREAWLKERKWLAHKKAFQAKGIAKAVVVTQDIKESTWFVKAYLESQCGCRTVSKAGSGRE